MGVPSMLVLSFRRFVVTGFVPFNRFSGVGDVTHGMIPAALYPFISTPLHNLPAYAYWQSLPLMLLFVLNPLYLNRKICFIIYFAILRQTQVFFFHSSSFVHFCCCRFVALFLTVLCLIYESKNVYYFRSITNYVLRNPLIQYTYIYVYIQFFFSLSYAIFAMSSAMGQTGGILVHIARQMKFSPERKKKLYFLSSANFGRSYGCEQVASQGG